MKLQEIYKLADSLAPFALSREFIERFGAYDNSGVMLDCGKEIEGILFSLDLSPRAIEEAKKTGANCIFTHHPAIWEKISQLTEGGRADNVVSCIQAGISVISAHLNLDAAPDGIDEWLMRGLGGTEAIAVMEELSGGGYGRVYNVTERSLECFTECVRKEFRTERVVVYGSAPVRKVASFCGGGFDSEAIEFATLHGADTIVSSDGKHHLVTEAVEKGLNVILLTHYAAENYGFMRFAEAIKERVNIPVVTFTDERYL